MADETAPAAITAVPILPVLPLRNTALFPFMFMPLSVGRPGSRSALEAALALADQRP